MMSRLTQTDVQGAAYPKLSDEHLGILEGYGEIRATRPGELLFKEGDARQQFFVLVQGEVEILEVVKGTYRTLAVREPGEFLGELNLLADQPPLVRAVARDTGQVIVISPERFKEVIAEEPVLSDIILRAFLRRRTLMGSVGVGLKIIGSRSGEDTLRLAEFAARNGLPHARLDPEAEEARELLNGSGLQPAEVAAYPVVILQEETILKNPTNSELARAVGLNVDAAPGETYDLIVVGAGPAGLAAAVYGASEGLSTLVLDAVAPGGQAGTSSRIENYLGFPAGLSGAELTSRAAVQADKFGARTSVPQQASALEKTGGEYVISLAEGGEVFGRGVIVATGARYRRLEVPRLSEFEGASVFYAASEVEARSCSGAEVAVVGGGNSAGQAALFLAEKTPKVYLLLRSAELGSGMSQYLADRVESTENIEVLTNTEIRELSGQPSAEGSLENIVVENNRSGERRTIPTRAIFVFIGADPHTGWLEGAVTLDKRGFIVTGTALERSSLDAETRETWGDHPRAPLFLETSLPGVFAAGDVRAGSVKRVASAAGEGSMAVQLVHQYLSETAPPAPFTKPSATTQEIT